MRVVLYNDPCDWYQQSYHNSSTIPLLNSSIVSRRSKVNKLRQDRLGKAPTSTFLVKLTSLASSTSIAEPQQQQKQQQQQSTSLEEPYSAKTGIKTAALLGGMLLLVVICLFWRARSRLWRLPLFSSMQMNDVNSSPRLSASKFDLDYWLKQVDLREANEAERYREVLSPYLELPTEEPRDNQAATASWIVDAWRHWYLINYRTRHQLLRQRTDEPVTSINKPYRPRQHYFLHRLIRRLLTPPEQRSSFLIEHSSTIIADMRSSVVDNSFVPVPAIANVQPRRVASWPRLQSTHRQCVSSMSALQMHLARQSLLQRTSKTMDDM